MRNNQVALLASAIVAKDIGLGKVDVDTVMQRAEMFKLWLDQKDKKEVNSD